MNVNKLQRNLNRESESREYEQKIAPIKRSHRARRVADSPDYSARNFVVDWMELYE